MKPLLRPILINLIAAIFILLFTYTALSKFLDFSNFKGVLHKSPIIGNNNIFIAWILPLAELVTVALLFLPKTRPYGLYVSLGLMSLFTLYIIYMLLFTPDLPCSCGGALKQLTWRQHLWFNVFFTGLAVVAIRLQSTHKRHQLNFLLQ